MQLSPEAVTAIKGELAHFASDLNLSDDQKDRLKGALEHARERFEMIKTNNPNLSMADIAAKLKEARGPLRQRVESFLTAEQLTKWDAEVAKAKSFLGFPIH